MLSLCCSDSHHSVVVLTQKGLCTNWSLLRFNAMVKWVIPWLVYIRQSCGSSDLSWQSSSWSQYQERGMQRPLPQVNWSARHVWYATDTVDYLLHTFAPLTAMPQSKAEFALWSNKRTTHTYGNWVHHWGRGSHCHSRTSNFLECSGHCGRQIGQLHRLSHLAKTNSKTKGCINQYALQGALKQSRPGQPFQAKQLTGSFHALAPWSESLSITTQASFVCTAMAAGLVGVGLWTQAGPAHRHRSGGIVRALNTQADAGLVSTILAGVVVGHLPKKKERNKHKQGKFYSGAWHGISMPWMLFPCHSVWNHLLSAGLHYIFQSVHSLCMLVVHIHFCTLEKHMIPKLT